MNVVIEPNAEATRIALTGRFDAHEVTGFRAGLDRAFADGHHNITVRLEDVNFLDSSALAELVRGMKHARQNGGDLVLVAPSDPVRVILELTGLDRAFVINEA